MPIRYERDEARRVVVITIDGEMPTIEEVRQLFQRHHAEDVWRYGMLYDLRRMIGRPSFDYLRGVTSKLADLAPGNVPRGPVALLTVDPILYAATCAYAALRRSEQRIRVFRDLDEANLWLAEDTA